MHDDAVVGLVDEVRRAGDVVEVGRLALPLVELAGVGDEPDVDAGRLSEALDFCEHLAHVLGLAHGGRALVVELVVRVDDETTDAVAVDGGAGDLEDPVDAGKLVVLVPNQVEAVVDPVQGTVQLFEGHPRRALAVGQVEEGLADKLLGQLPRVIGGTLFHRAHRKLPSLLLGQVAQERVDPLALAAVGHARDDGQLARHHPVVLVEARPARLDPLPVLQLEVVVLDDVVVVLVELEQPPDGQRLGALHEVLQHLRAVFHQHVVGVLPVILRVRGAVSGVSALVLVRSRFPCRVLAIHRPHKVVVLLGHRPPHSPAPLPAQAPGQLLRQRISGPVVVGRNHDPHGLVQPRPRIPQVRVLGVLLGPRQVALLHTRRRAVRHAHDVRDPRLLQRQLVNLPLDDDDLTLPQDVVQSVQHLLGPLALPKPLVQRPVLDIHQQVVRVIREADHSRFRLQLGIVHVDRRYLVPLQRLLRDAARGEELDHLVRQRHELYLRPHDGLVDLLLLPGGQGRQRSRV